MSTSENKVKIGAEAEDKGLEFVCERYGIAKETAKRYRRNYRKSTRDIDQTIIDSNTTIQQIIAQYSEKELKQLANGKVFHRESSTAIHKFDGDTLKIGVWSDTHIGSKYTNYDYILGAMDEFEREKVDFIVHAGDVTEGLSNRQGHMYECTEIGYKAQKEKAIELLSQWDLTEQYMISGNHDMWYMKSAGANIVKDICDAIPNATFLGDDEGTVIIPKDYLNVDIYDDDGLFVETKDVHIDHDIRLWHGLDGSSYATSYRVQKLVESLTGGNKPSCLITGHVHKMGYFFERHIHCLSAGCIQKQSKWMRGKKLQAHVGFWIIEMTLNEKGIARFKPEFYPFYM